MKRNWLIISLTFLSVCACDLQENLQERNEHELPTLYTVEISELKSSSVILGGVVSFEGASSVTEYGICWSQNPEPTIEDNVLQVGEGRGTFECQVTGLQQGILYYFRAYARNLSGVSYGKVVSATTPIARLAVVVTLPISEAFGTNAMSGGEITNDGNSLVVKRGVCWAKHENPTTDDFKTEDGQGKGKFTSSITGIEPEIPYYVRAYAINEVGVSYGEQLSFTTLAPKAPTVETGKASNQTDKSVTIAGNVTNDGGSPLLERGICWSFEPQPEINMNKVLAAEGMGEFICRIHDMEAGRIYYVRAYATNAIGTAYGKEIKTSALYAGWGDEMVLVKGGTFTAGGDIGKFCAPAFQATVKDAYVARLEVTQKLYKEIMGQGYYNGVLNESNIERKDELAMPRLHWLDAVRFCNKFSVKKGYEPCYSVDGEEDPDKWPQSKDWLLRLKCDFFKDGYRLPMAVEWEYVAGGGAEKRTLFAGTNMASELPIYGWTDIKGDPKIVRQGGRKLPNQLGLFDMNGNLTEWCWEWKHSYTSTPKVFPEDVHVPSPSEKPSEKIKKGGSFWSWGGKAYYVQTNWRGPDVGDGNPREYHEGFRLFRTAK